MENGKKKLHLIGNAHIDPVWLWRFGDGLAEIKATFRSALDRIKEFDEFIFTSACAFYYKWVEENCIEMFEEIKEAVKEGRWCIVGGTWTQADCNIPSSESFARHYLYSQNYFYEKFGVIANTGYNVDSFGHSAGMPRLLKNGRLNNYVFMRPTPGAEKEYPFVENFFKWKCGNDTVDAFRIVNYTSIYLKENMPPIYDDYTDGSPCDFMLFYGVGNHGGGPTVENINWILSYMPKARNEFVFSNPDKYFESVKNSEVYEKLPIYEGELQNHASGCYSANSTIKFLNRKAESILVEAEKLNKLASHLKGFGLQTGEIKRAWEAVMFNQFHDVICGCSTKAACKDAYGYISGAASDGFRIAYSAAEKISWSVDTSKGIESIRKGTELPLSILWEQDKMGTPIVVFNPLSHSVRVPVYVHSFTCKSITDEHDNPVDFQFVHSDYTVCYGPDLNETTGARFMAELPAFGYRTYWVYGEKEFERKEEKSSLEISDCRIANGKIEVLFDRKKGNISCIKDVITNEVLSGECSRALIINDGHNDTWSHGHFVFDDVVGEFSEPEFSIYEDGLCEVALRVVTKYKNSILEQIYTLYEDDTRVHVKSRIVLNEELVMVKLAFDSLILNGQWLREVPGCVAAAKADGREQPMQRYMMTESDSRRFAIVNDSKYSSSANGQEMRFVAARSCHYADHGGPRHENLHVQDIGEQEFKYIIMPKADERKDVVYTAEELHTEFIAVPETYHKGNLSQTMSLWESDSDNITLIAWKQAENGKGDIVRLSEIEGKKTLSKVKFSGCEFILNFEPYDIKTIRIYDGEIIPCDFIEWDI